MRHPESLQAEFLSGGNQQTVDQSMFDERVFALVLVEALSLYTFRAASSSVVDAMPPTVVHHHHVTEFVAAVPTVPAEKVLRHTKPAVPLV